METLFEAEKYYHVYNHAIGIENLFRNKENYLYFLKKYGEYMYPVTETLSYCLMPNHFHLLIKVRDETTLLNFYKEKLVQKKDKQKLVEFNPQNFSVHSCVMQEFGNFLNGYAKAYNKMYERKGSLWLRHLEKKEVNTNAYLSKIIHYIHYNPIHHGFCKDILAWDYSSIHAFLTDKNTKIAKKEVLEWFGDKHSFWEFHQHKPDVYLEKELEF
jgi:putative transposase